MTQQTLDETIEAIRRECSDQALHTFGTAWIFEQRANRLNLQLNLLTYLSFLAPLLAGGLVLGYGASAAFLP